MSTTTRSTQIQGLPSKNSRPASGWVPNLKGTDLPRQAVNGIQQGFSLLYSLRDTANQTQTDVSNLIQYGNWLERLQQNPQALPNGALWFVTDRPNICYQVRIDPKSTTLQWFFGTGIQWKNVSTTAAKPIPDVLGLNDAGYMVITASFFEVWDGTKWLTLF